MHSRVSINTLCLTPASLREQAEIIARLGARAATPVIDQVLAEGINSAAGIFRDAGLGVAGLTHLSFGFATPDKASAERARLLQSIGIAAQIGAQNIVMTTGNRGEHSWPEAAKRFADAMAPCAEAARAAGIGLGIEPTSHLYAHASIAHRLADTVTLARMGGISPIIDIFACWTDSDIDEALHAAAPLCPLAQISDYVYGDRGLPCRAIPGDGAIPFERIVPVMAKAGFTGWWDLEILGPRIVEEGPEAGLKRAAAHIGNLLEQAGVVE
ncbi:MAG: sugar phosphate isomerase/epimerase family protein [Novosphingobium sp.]